MKKRIIGIGAACLTACTVVAGCGASSNTTETTTTAETTTTTTATTEAPTTTTTEAPTTTTTEAPTTTTTQAPTTTANAHPEDDKIMEYLRGYYKSHDTSAGVPRGDDYGHYRRYAIADFDADEKNELAVEYKFDDPSYDVTNIFMYNADNIDFENFETIISSIGYNSLSDVVFQNNGVAYTSFDSLTDVELNPEREYLDKKFYHIISGDVLQKLNYDLSDLTDINGKLYLSFVLHYYKENGIIYKILGSGQEAYYEPKEETQAEYEADKAILDSGSVMNLDIKDFTAENLGL